MNDTNPILVALSKIAPLTREEIEFIASGAEPRNYKKGEMLTKEGDVENYVYFILKGGVRNYCTHDGEELDLDFFFEGDFTNSFMSFLLREKSIVNVKALVDTQVLRFHVDFVRKLYEDSLNFNKIGRIVAESLYIRRTRRELSFITHSAKERYEFLLANHPEFVQRIPLKYLASFLGINPETLSRIRKAMASKK
ncbi:Crp/Fnr family transcriptional regulator [Oscillatoria amoena NRMC-F 0135]|nr:Crp/Fnr family transcriptional regulator [Oscillatoria amoena NRMC-F 0135]